MQNDRKFLKSDRWEEWREVETDQRKRVPPPPPQKPYDEGVVLIDLVAPKNMTVGSMPLIEVIERRRSRRKFTAEALTLEALSFLLWATQGISSVIKRADGKVVNTLRTVPSGGARHPFETYLLVNRVEGLKPGLYRYLPLDHKVYLIDDDAALAEKVHKASYDQYVMQSAVTFIWTTIPYRTEWRYSLMAPKLVNLDAGHVCQNLYLAATSINAGVCAIAAYNQKELDALLGVNGEDEFAIYVAPVGKI